MKKFYSILIIAIFAIFISFDYGNAYSLGGEKLIKNGTGKRTKWILGTIYYISLYVTPDMKGKSGKEIIESGKPSAVLMKVDTSLLTRDRFLSAVKKGFKKAAKSGYPTGKKRAFLNLFNNIEIKVGDILYLNYIPKKGIVSKLKTKSTGKVKTIGTTSGLSFKKALYAIWLGKNPVQKSCKKGMLRR